MDLNLSITQLLLLFGPSARLQDVDAKMVCARISSLDKAGPADLAILLDRGQASVFDAVDTQVVSRCEAGVILAQAPVVAGKPYLLVPDVLVAFTQMVQHLAGKDVPSADQPAQIHPSAVVDASAVIGLGTSIGAGVYVGKKCRIGAQVMLHPGVQVLDGTVIGDRSVVHSNVVLGSDGFGYQVTARGMRKIPHVGIVRVGNDVEIGAGCMIDRAMFDATVLSDGVKLDNGVHVAHNVFIGPSTAILAQTAIAGSVQIGAGCQIGGQVAIKDHVKIGNGARIVSKSAVMHNLEDGVTVAGIPAIPFGNWKRIAVCMNRLPELFKLKEKFAHILDSQEQ